MIDGRLRSGVSSGGRWGAIALRAFYFFVISTSSRRSTRASSFEGFEKAKRVAHAGGSRERLALGNLSIRCDWGWAPDYVEAMWKMRHHANDRLLGSSPRRPSHPRFPHHRRRVEGVRPRFVLQPTPGRPGWQPRPDSCGRGSTGTPLVFVGSQFLIDDDAVAVLPGPVLQRQRDKSEPAGRHGVPAGKEPIIRFEPQIGAAFHRLGHKMGTDRMPSWAPRRRSRRDRHCQSGDAQGLRARPSPGMSTLARSRSSSASNRPARSAAGTYAISTQSKDREDETTGKCCPR
jgi:hypothetical protein